jgi:protein gp37
MMGSNIEWTDETWNPVTGCTKVSAGCQNCYAERMARRLAGRFGYPEYPNQFDVTCHPDRLDEPLRRRKPTTYFVCSMGDLFHEHVPSSFIGKVFAYAIAADWHTFLILTKRPERMRDFVVWFEATTGLFLRSFRHIWAGVSAEDQERADERIPFLEQTRVSKRFVNFEPLLGPVDVGPYIPSLDWVIDGGESGPKARPSHPDWFRKIRDDCVDADVPYFHKQNGAWVDDRDWVSSAHKLYERKERTAYVDDRWMARVGKKKASRLLDGREWNQMPE